MSNFGGVARFVAFLVAATVLVAIVGAVIFMVVGFGAGAAVKTVCTIAGIC